MATKGIGLPFVGALVVAVWSCTLASGADPAKTPTDSAVNAKRPAMSSAMDLTQARPVPPTAGILPTPTSNATAPATSYPANGASSRGASSATVSGSGYGYNRGSEYAPVITSFSASPAAYKALGEAAPAEQAPLHTPASIRAGVSPVPTVAGDKPFSDYTPPPVYSPYLNLFRNDNNHGRINNYYSLVRPVIEQNRRNYQTQGSLQSLQSTTRTQSYQLQQLNQRTQPPASTTAPGFMNQQNYYPGLGR